VKSSSWQAINNILCIASHVDVSKVTGWDVSEDTAWEL
jgi:hypothetical protein